MSIRYDRCEICASSEGNKIHFAREQMFGLGGSFQYLECADCGCLQLLDPPDDLGEYYPPGYYSMSGDPTRGFAIKSLGLRAMLKNAIGEHRSPLGWILNRIVKPPDFFEWFREAPLQLDDAILDIGCGRGARLLDMKATGFESLQGVDPFIESTIEYPHGVRISKQEISSLAGGFDFIMMNHSFEHIASPQTVLSEVERLLKPNRRALIRIPVIGAAWREYGVDWVGLDAPRHLYLHTKRSMQKVAESAGLVLERVVFESTESQFIESERYRRGISWQPNACSPGYRASDLFSREEIEEFKQRARLLNELEDGDAARFYLLKP